MVKKLPLNLPKLQLPGIGGDKAISPVSVVLAMAGAVFDKVSTNREERAFIEKLVDEYRPEIAAKNRISAEQVTQDLFEQALQENIVLAQARHAARVDPGTRITSAAVATIAGTVAGSAAAGVTRKTHTNKEAANNAANIAAGIVGTISAMLGGKITRILFKNKSGAKALKGTAHAEIMAIKEQQQKGQETTPMDVFRVQLAVNPEVAVAIQHSYGKPFAELDAQTQQGVLQTEFPELFQLNAEIAQRINDGARPQGLVFGEVVAPDKTGNRVPVIDQGVVEADVAEAVEPLGVGAQPSAEAGEHLLNMLQPQLQESGEPAPDKTELQKMFETLLQNQQQARAAGVLEPVQVVEKGSLPFAQRIEQERSQREAQSSGPLAIG